MLGSASHLDVTDERYYSICQAGTLQLISWQPLKKKGMDCNSLSKNPIYGDKNYFKIID